MHEYSIARSIIEIAVEEARRHGLRRVQAVRLRVGVLRQIVSALLQSAFDSVSAGTPIAGSQLEIEVGTVQIGCAACGRVSPSVQLLAECPACGSPRIHFSGGMDMAIVSICAENEESSHDHPGAAQRA